jgi:hypothetical protein
MNDCKAVYRKVNHFVQCLYPGQLTGNLRRNMNTLVAMVTGIIIGKETQLPLIALNMPEEIKVPSTEKRFKRLLINEKITEQTYFLPFIQGVLVNLGLEEMILAIDGSLVGRGCICLMISLIYKGRALPLVFTVVKGNKGHLPEDTHVELVNKLRPLIPEVTNKSSFWAMGSLTASGYRKPCRALAGSTCPEPPPISPYTLMMNPFRSKCLLPCCQKAIAKACETAKSPIKNTDRLPLLPGGAMTRKSPCFW